jgi:hypothetical protein
LRDGGLADRLAVPGCKGIVTQYDEVRFRKAAEAACPCGSVLKDNLLEVRRFIEPPV